jgi:hypothetical protein
MMNRQDIYDKMAEIEELSDEVDSSEGMYALHWDDVYDIEINGRVIPASSLLLTDTTLDVFGVAGFQKFEFSEIQDLEL